MEIFHKLWHYYLKRPYRLVKTIDYGEGQVILLIHGLAGKSKSWSPLVKQIDPTKWHAIGFDLLGFGDSPKPSWSTYDIHAHSRALLHSLKKVHGKDKGKIIIIAHSMGCLIASHIAYSRPDLVEKLILFEPPLYAETEEFKTHAKRKKFYYKLYQSIATKPNLVLAFSRIATRTATLLYSFTVTKESWAAFERSLKNTIMNQKAIDELKHIPVTTHIVHGSLDFVVTKAEVRDMLKDNRNISFYTIAHVHGISARAGKYLLRLAEGDVPKPKNRNSVILGRK